MGLWRLMGPDVWHVTMVTCSFPGARPHPSSGAGTDLWWLGSAPGHPGQHNLESRDLRCYRLRLLHIGAWSLGHQVPHYYGLTLPAPDCISSGLDAALGRVSGHNTVIRLTWLGLCWVGPRTAFPPERLMRVTNQNMLLEQWLYSSNRN